VVTCPWHGWQYDVTTGANTMDESERVERYEVKVEGSAVLVAGVTGQPPRGFLNCGGRFSRKALRPSSASGVW
jgi:hypothetical protein